MKILLDEQLPVKLKYRFQPQLNISTVKDEQWFGLKNGILIQTAIGAGFNVFITNDQNLAYQQKLIQYNILFINILQPSNRYDDILSVMLEIKEWLLKEEAEIAERIKTKNYLVYSIDL